MLYPSLLLKFLTGNVASDQILIIPFACFPQVCPLGCFEEVEQSRATPFPQLHLPLFSQR